MNFSNDESDKVHILFLISHSRSLSLTLAHSRSLPGSFHVQQQCVSSNFSACFSSSLFCSNSRHFFSNSLSFLFKLAGCNTNTLNALCVHTSVVKNKLRNFS